MALPFIMVAPNGARRNKTDHPALPIRTDEIIATAAACYTNGAQALHLHVRDARGEHSLDAGRYRETLAELALRVPQLRVQITTEAAGRFDVAAQLACLRTVQAAWASIAVREIARAPDLARAVYSTCADHATEVQHILYDTDDLAQLLAWRAQGIVHADQHSVLFVLGRYRVGQTSSPDDVRDFLAARPETIHDWMVCAFGAREHDCLVHAAQRGGSVRVGFENSLCAADGTPHADNAASVAALVQSLRKSLP